MTLLVAMGLAPGGTSITPGVAAAAAASTASVGPFTFQLGPYELQALPADQLPYNWSTLVPSCGLTDANGVAIYKASDGMLYDHPVAQGGCALSMLSNYRLTGDTTYLDQAIANAQRLLARAVAWKGAIFFPYPFNYTNSGRSTMTAPWYSALAQGHGLAVFVRLYEVTGDASWLTAAQRTFASFKVARDSTHPTSPWVVGIVDGMLWFDEYPTVPLDRVFNGHNFAIFGLYDYWRITSDADARLLILGALNSSYVAAVGRVRVPGGISQYCVSDACMALRVRNSNYHPVHIGQLATLYRLTGHWHFASLAEAFTADSPLSAPGTAHLTAGVHAAYTFDAAGHGTLATTLTLASDASYSYSRREVPGARVNPGNGVWLRLSDGPLAGLWVRESSRVWPQGFVETMEFYWPRPVGIEAGHYAASDFAGDGSVVGTSSADSPATEWTYTASARINGRPSVRLASGPLAGLWLTLDSRTVRDSSLFADIDASIFRNDIIWLTTKGITRGCSAYAYCPSAAVTREQMASFLVRSLHLHATAVDYFTDDDGRSTEGDINQLAAAGITAGCATHRFCPERPLTRAEMASLLARAFNLKTSAVDYFADDDESPHEGDINRLAQSGITRGCSANRFCPSDTITRGQMAAMLHRAFTGAGLTETSEQPLTPTVTPSPVPSPTPAATPTPTPTVAPPDPLSPSPSPAPGEEPTPVPIPSLTPSPAASPEPTPTVGSG